MRTCGRERAGRPSAVLRPRERAACARRQVARRKRAVRMAGAGTHRLAVGAEAGAVIHAAPHRLRCRRAQDACQPSGHQQPGPHRGEARRAESSPPAARVFVVRGKQPRWRGVPQKPHTRWGQDDMPVRHLQRRLRVLGRYAVPARLLVFATCEQHSDHGYCNGIMGGVTWVYLGDKNASPRHSPNMRGKDFTAARAAWYASWVVPKEVFPPGFPPGTEAVISQRTCAQG